MEGFNELELLRMAKGVEEEGYRFYMKAAERFQEENIKQMFQYLALEEAEHIRVFEQLHDRVAERLGNSEEYVMEEEVMQYLKAISDTAVFNTKSITYYKVEQVNTVKDALMIGIQAEKDSILFYETFLANTKTDMTRKVLERLIKEEIKHLHHFRVLVQTI